MPLSSTVQSGVSYGASFISSATKAAKNAAFGTASTSAKVATGVAKAAMFATVPNSPAVLVGVGVATLYAREMTKTHAPRVFTNLCVTASTAVMGPTMGPFIGNTVIAPICVPTLTTVAVAGVSAATYVVATTLGNTIHYYTSQKEDVKSKDFAKTAEINIADFVVIEPGIEVPPAA